jgi:hypothetical protein
MFCPTCGQTLTEGSRFCMHCGFCLTPAGEDENTVLDSIEATVLQSSEDFLEKTRLISGEPLQLKPEKLVKTQKPLFFAWLVSVEGSDKGKDFRILKEKTSIGKQDNSDILIKRDFISRNHAVLIYQDQEFILTDLHSTNHTYVNSEKISRRILRDNDIIKFGEAVYKFKCL